MDFLLVFQLRAIPLRHNERILTRIGDFALTGPTSPKVSDRSKDCRSDDFVASTIFDRRIDAPPTNHSSSQKTMLNL